MDSETNTKQVWAYKIMNTVNQNTDKIERERGAFLLLMISPRLRVFHILSHVTFPLEQHG